MERTLVCDRCHRRVTGMEVYVEGVLHATSGFYDVSQGQWQRFARPGEAVLCDACMSQDTQYRQEYGVPEKG